MDKTYTIIPDFMLDYDLTLSETVALAVIYGFCQDGESDFHGSYSYLARKIKIERRSAMRIVERLIAKGLVEKQVQEVKGVKSCSFRTTFKGGDRMSPVVTQSHQGGDRMSPGGGDRMSPNNISIENIKEKKDIKFNFLSALKSLGVSDEVARDWMAVRKTKRATNTKTAFDRIKTEIDKSGRTADECIRIAVEKSWRGFQADWLPAKKDYTVWHGTMAEYLRLKGKI